MKNCGALEGKTGRIRRQGRAGEKKHFSALNLVLGRAGDAVKGKVAV